MSGDSWERIEAIAAAALDRPPSERPALLDRECADDEGLRREVESLLAFEGAAEGFLRQSAMEEAAQAVASQDIADDDWTIDGYDIAEFIGAGGMGDVYRARERRLERDVAIKVIRRSHGDPPVAFEEEARAASALSHPNIVTIYAVGSRDDLAYIVMELVQGRTLRALLGDGLLPLVTTLDIALQLAEGLAAAHALGVVHRDLKPDNVMVTTDGLVKILDFGIAKRERSSSSAPYESARSPVTATSTLAGTAGYMSPEQAARGPIDHRSDQFSFGAIVHEMLVGTRPADAESIQSVGLGPAPLVHVINRCLSPRAEQRYDTTREIALEIRRIRDDTAHTLRQRTVTRRQAIWVGAAAALTVAAGAATWRVLAETTRVRRLLVLPFTSVASDESTDSLCDGITEVLIKQLGRMTDVTVIGRDTAFSLKGKPHDPRELGRQLGIDAVLNGSVVRRGGRLLVRVELVKTTTAIRLWGDDFNSSEADVLAIQDEIAAAIITRGLGRSLSSQERLVLNRMLTADPEAYRLFLSAVHHLRLEHEADYLIARRLLEDAVARDPSFALALVTLASTYSVSAIDGFEEPRAAWEQQRMHVTRALQEDPALPDALAERATEAFFYQWDWAAARREWDNALNARRSEVQAELLTSYALQQWALGQNADALRFAQTAREVDPLSPGLAVREADLLAATGQSAAAADLYSRVIREAPDEPKAYFGLAEVWRSLGRFDDAIDVWRRAFHAAGNASLDDAFAVAHGEKGFRDVARHMAELELAGLEAGAESGAYVSSADLARVHARLGRYEQSFKFLDAAFGEHAPGLVFLKVDTAWDGMRGDPRFAAYLRRMKLV